MLVIQKLHKQFPRRVVEWGLSNILITWGLIVLLTDGLFEKYRDIMAFKGWLSLAPQPVWGTAALSVGGIRLAALYINGAHYRSPVARTVAGFFSMFIWFWATVGVLKGTPWLTPALAIYPWLMIGDAYAVYTAAGDAFTSNQIHLNKKSQEYARG